MQIGTLCWHIVPQFTDPWAAHQDLGVTTAGSRERFFGVLEDSTETSGMSCETSALAGWSPEATGRIDSGAAV